ncbi:MAG: cell division protein ZapA [Burkholderiales bacterium]|nr:cell division protein ZapA [Burkholderiales bacterium]
MTAKGTDAGGRAIQLDIHLLGRDYKVACREHERADLLEAVAFLDQRMREIRGASKSAGADRIAVMAALNIANELLRERKAVPPAPVATTSTSMGEIDDGAAQRRIQSMHTAIDQALAGQEKLI